MITYTPTELQESIEYALTAKNTDDYPPFMWARIAKILAQEIVNLRAEKEGTDK